MQTEVKIIIPEGMKIDKENSTFECIKFKPKKLTYDDIVKKLFCYEESFCVNATSEDQCKKLLALNKLINVATYLNEGWKVDFQRITNAYYPVVIKNDIIHYCQTKRINPGIPCFKTPELIKKAIEILGEETIRIALS